MASASAVVVTLGACAHICSKQTSFPTASILERESSWITLRAEGAVGIKARNFAGPLNRGFRLLATAQDDSQPDLSGSNAEPQLVVPNLTAASEYWSTEFPSLEESTLDDSVDQAEDDEEENDSWLSEFQSEVERIKQTWGEVDTFAETPTKVPDYTEAPRLTSRRRLVGAPMFMSLAYFVGWGSVAGKVCAVEKPARIDLSTTPSAAQFDAGDQRLQKAASIFRQALEAPTVKEEEDLWTEVITNSEDVKAEWVHDILARAYGNRGNARSRQGKLEQALTDYNRSIQLAPYAVDPVLNRGVALENLGRYDEAAADYEAVLEAQPEDPAAWNNLGNVKAAMSQWDDALRSYLRAVKLAPKFSFAAANYALALYQVGRDNEAIRQFRNLLRRYPEFADVRAALAVSLYAQGLFGEAETNWDRIEDGRYRDREWIRKHSSVAAEIGVCSRGLSRCQSKGLGSSVVLTRSHVHQLTSGSTTVEFPPKTFVTEPYHRQKVVDRGGC